MSTVLDIAPESTEHAELDFARISPEVRRKLRPLNKLDNYHGVLGLLQDFAVIAVSVYLCVGMTWWFYPISAILIGSTQRAFASLLHESAHKILAKNPTLNLLL